VASATEAAPARAPVTPRALRKHKLTIARAIDQWVETTQAIEGLKPLQKEAAEVLLEHARRTGRRTFKDRIAVTDTGGSLILDQAKVVEYLGARLRDFQTRTKLGLSLKLLSKD
jgi:hypothetical protein